MPMEVAMRIRALTLALAGVVTASGCAAMREDPYRTPSYYATLDAEVIAYVESRAARHGTDVVWVNPPRKKAEERR
jgi:hypothetical protein